jgi:cellulose biosynthesis protein BcsQ
MNIIAFLNPSGGSGKATATINVSSCLANSGKRVAVVDTDPQMSLTNWNNSRMFFCKYIICFDTTDKLVSGGCPFIWS